MYKILTNKSPSKLMFFAANELSTFIEKATGEKWEVVYKTKKDEKYISLCYDEFTKEIENEIPKDFNSSGFIIRTVNENYLIAGKSEHAVLYGVYELLKRWIGFHVYAKDEIYYETNKVIDFKPINFEYCPKIEYRQVQWYGTADPATANRMKVFTGGWNMDGDLWDWYNKFWGGGYFAHTVFKNLPPERDKNGKLLHPDWYNEEENQLCLTNAEMYNQFLLNLKKHIEKHSDASFFSIGIEDNSSYCKCEACRKSDEKYGGPCGTYLRFVKKLAVDVEKWRKTELPKSNFKLVVFAYLWTKNPPFKYESGKYLPFKNDMVLPDNVVVFNAPIDACGIHSLDAPCNKTVNDRFKKWQVYAKYSFVWDYHLYHDDVLIFFPGLWQYKNNIKKYESYNTVLLFNEGQANDNTTGFADLKTYLLAELSYNSDLDVDYLINDFIERYYKKSAPKIKEYLNCLKKHYSVLEKQYAKLGARGYHVSYDIAGHPDVLTERHFPLKFMLKLEKLLKNAELLADDDIILKRVKREELFVKHILIELHTYYCSLEEYDKRLNEFKQIVDELGDVYCKGTWFQKDKDPSHSPTSIVGWYDRLSCRYPVRADKK